jgi:2-polyprenyl-6-methoxyphenol hydroxylase-like FAD-dependent oxidoreductase
MTGNSYGTAVIGGGFYGCFIAAHLREAGQTVVLLEKEDSLFPSGLIHCAPQILAIAAVATVTARMVRSENAPLRMSCRALACATFIVHHPPTGVLYTQLIIGNRVGDTDLSDS